MNGWTGKKVKKVLICDVDKCTGCSICELICSMAHNHGESNPKKSFIKVIKDEDFDINIPVLSSECTQCGKCVEFCMPQALAFVSPGEAAIVRKATQIGKIPVPSASQLLMI